MLVVTTIVFVLSSLLAFSQTPPKNQEPGVYYLVSLDVAKKWKKSIFPVLENPKLKEVLSKHSQYMDKMSNNGLLALGGPLLEPLPQADGQVISLNTMLQGVEF